MKTTSDEQPIQEVETAHTPATDAEAAHTEDETEEQELDKDAEEQELDKDAEEPADLLDTDPQDKLAQEKAKPDYTAGRKDPPSHIDLQNHTDKPDHRTTHREQ